MHKILLDDFLRATLKEDMGKGDLYSRIENNIAVESYIIVKEDGILSGRIYVERLCELLGIEVEFSLKDGEAFCKGTKIATFKGKMSAILGAERTILNLLQHSSGIATLTNKYVKALEGTQCVLLDTRKTRPLLRDFEKYSTRNGGAINHRFGLDDCLMLKDTHLSRILSLSKFIQEIREKIPFTTKIEVECENILQAKEALESRIDILMCDNMEAAAIKEVVKMRDLIAPNVLLEASGNITLANLKEYAKSGIDAISSGAIIHQATWIDMSMRID
ncbi:MULTISPECIES: carboxylating nicotinate-nucleotide diphosphorylase [Helicobacter]|uniref:carboxylating nicotinate-nucleotide diphosphorylase n=1 Tax=Helicobacter TaxID=209 RepID=UPI00202A4913|nr:MULTISPECIES: carboxylating nicotinate-nucleotide diphosphorylase [Helicobacter]MCI7047766.1 carboxylating nicotinate-nucleotide diphosphorylase [Helicobacter sp.]MCI7766156.1 carboxylating nicotinate-nucleotide diphosphorylase [Helicobacter sp.]MCL9823452.1 carboxylating nicotinate-nucleotide diphosphorylase [Helicobacter colisuis]MDY4427232.1 carboxylating nicotinate-nucleotide diphosphorylase [Helicobacter sp.]MDY5615668.1 carboxylating nicotinate-nucleotide diphosphorylase [Helicobacter